MSWHLLTGVLRCKTPLQSEDSCDKSYKAPNFLSRDFLSCMGSDLSDSGLNHRCADSRHEGTGAGIADRFQRLRQRNNQRFSASVHRPYGHDKIPGRSGSDVLDTMFVVGRSEGGRARSEPLPLSIKGEFDGAFANQPELAMFVPVR